MGTKLSKAPVFFALAQVLFDEQLRLDESIVAIQEKFKEHGFPVFQRQVFVTTITPSAPAAPNSVAVPSMQVQAQSRYIFAKLDQSSSFSLERNGLAFYVNKYEDYHAFAEAFFVGISIVHEVLKLSYLERIGIRYLDAVIPQAGETLDAYLVSQMLGVSHLISKKLEHAISETVFAEDKMKLVARAIIREGMIGVPIELAELMPSRPDFANLTGLCGTIDTDAGYEERIAFDLGVVKTKLQELHDEASNAFRTIVTTTALDRWK